MTAETTEKPEAGFPLSAGLGPRFVTATLIDRDESRQGVLLFERPKSCLIRGESGVLYRCHPNPVCVPLKDLWGGTREFAISMGVYA